jgi:hypothetical protein
MSAFVLHIQCVHDVAAADTTLVLTAANSPQLDDSEFSLMQVFMYGITRLLVVIPRIVRCRCLFTLPMLCHYRVCDTCIL